MSPCTWALSYASMQACFRDTGACACACDATRQALPRTHATSARGTRYITVKVRRSSEQVNHSARSMVPLQLDQGCHAHACVGMLRRCYTAPREGRLRRLDVDHHRSGSLHARLPARRSRWWCVERAWACRQRRRGCGKRRSRRRWIRCEWRMWSCRSGPQAPGCRRRGRSGPVVCGSQALVHATRWRPADRVRSGRQVHVRGGGQQLFHSVLGREERSL